MRSAREIVLQLFLTQTFRQRREEEQVEEGTRMLRLTEDFYLISAPVDCEGRLCLA